MDKVVPSTATLEWLKATCGELLGTTNLKEQDDFFELGADSLTVIRLFARIEQNFGADKINLDQLFEFSRIDQIASILAQS